MKPIFDCTFAPYYDIAKPVDYLTGSTNKQSAYQVQQFCHDIQVQMGINKVTFTNDTTVDLLVKLNPNGFFFEKAKN